MDLVQAKNPKLKELPKILVLLNRIDIGGTTINTIPLVHHLQVNYQVQVAFGLLDSNVDAIAYFKHKYPSVSFISLPHIKKRMGLLGLVKSLMVCNNLVKEFKPNIIHSHGSVAGVLARCLVLLHVKIMAVHTYHGHLFHSYFSSTKTSFIILLEKLLAKCTRKIIVLGNSQQQDVVYKYKITNASKTAIIPLGIDEMEVDNTPLVKDQKRAFKAQFNIAEDALVIALIGRLVPVKNPLLFVDICISVQQKNPLKKYAFLVVGNGEMMDAVQTYAYQFKLSEGSKFIFTSWITPIAKAHFATDILLLTSLNEGTPLCLIEAQFCGKPVVASNVGGVSDIVQNNTTGFLINQPLVENFVQKIEELYKNKEMYASMSLAAKNFVKENFAFAKQVELTHKLYQECLTT